MINLVSEICGRSLLKHIHLKHKNTREKKVYDLPDYFHSLVFSGLLG